MRRLFIRFWRALKKAFFDEELKVVEQEKRLDTLYRPIWVDDLPEGMIKNSLYLIGFGKEFRCAALLCPCGCGDDIYLNTLPHDQEPSWRVFKDWDGNISVYPSIWRSKGCQSHFFITHGKVEWCTSVINTDIYLT
jgi:hypothetical protein